MAVIEASQLSKRFGKIKALDGLSLTVNAGEIHGFLGPNGAGKSTTIRALLGQIRLNSGTARVFGLDAWRKAVKIHSRLAYVPGEVSLWPNLTGGECIDIIGRFQGSLDKTLKAEYLERFGLDPSTRVKNYSKGNRQKVALVAALSTRAELLILDEPTSGLDPLMEAEFQRCIHEIKEQGRTVLLSSHILAEVEQLCDRVTIIRSGRVVSEGTLDELRGQTGVKVSYVCDTPIAEVPNLTGVSHLTQENRPDGTHVTFQVARDAASDVIALVASRHPRSLFVEPPSLDELFLAKYQSEDGTRPRRLAADPQKAKASEIEPAENDLIEEKRSR